MTRLSPLPPARPESHTPTWQRSRWRAPPEPKAGRSGGDPGSIGIENELSADDVASADIVILTKDIGIKSEERFAGKTIVRVNISDAVKRADAIMNKIDSHLSQKA